MKVPSSIRECVSLNAQTHKEYFDDQCKTIKRTVSDTNRKPLPSYRAPASLLDRVKVALSGARARRDRACGRLNTFVSSSSNEMESMFHKVAMDKFMRVYNKSSKTQQELMKEKLTNQAYNALSKELQARELHPPVIYLDDMPSPPPPPVINLDDMPSPPPPPVINLDDVPSPPPL